MTLDIDTALAWRGKTVLDRNGEEIGRVGDIYLDRETDLPAYAGVTAGLFGTKSTYCRLDDAEPVGDDIRVPFDKAHVLDAPSIDPDVALTAHEEALLDEHYGAATEEPETGAVSAGGEAAPAGAVDAGDEDAVSTGDEPVEVVRSEEEASFRTESRPKERIRLKKVLVTEHVEKTVPVRREEVRVEREPPA